MRHQPGAEMVADMGTKPLSAVKMKEHKLRLGMSIQEPEEKIKKSPQQKDQWKPREEGGRLKLALLMAMIARGKAEEDQEETAKGGRELESVIIIYTILVVVVTLMVQRLQRYLTSKMPKKVGKEELPLNDLHAWMSSRITPWRNRSVVSLYLEKRRKRRNRLKKEKGWRNALWRRQYVT